MVMTTGSYETRDESKQSLTIDSPYFPAYFRLLKWKVLDLCVQSMKNGEIGYFANFEGLFPPGKLIEVVRKITEETPDYTMDPLYQKIRNDEELEEKAKRQAETFLRVRHEHKYKVQRRMNSEYFLKKILFNEEGIRIADEIMYYNSLQVYQTAHWTSLPEGWMTTETFKERFYDPEELTSPYSLQRLDRVANAARGMIILGQFKANPQCQNEYNVLVRETDDWTNQCQTELVIKMLDDGPMFELRMENGEEKMYEASKWNVHKTLILFFYISGFQAKSEREQEEWYYALLDAMKNDPSNRAALHFLNKNYVEELYEREQERERLNLQKRKGLVADEEGVGEEMFTEIRPQKVDLNFNPDASSAAELILRNYQEELVQPAIEGKNCVIVAPTGSGKTEVAIYAAMNHIHEKHSMGKAARVVLLVPKIPLVDQQKKRFLQYCGGRYNVNGFHGSEKSDNNDGRRDDVLESHVVVMTPQILINMLQSVRQSERLYVSDFSMLIFDEVHHTTGNHPYVVINQLVQEWEHSKPQIVGLTASLNVSMSGQNEMTQMLNGIYKMLALLNTPHLSTIRKEENLETLNSLVPKPDDSVEICRPKECELRRYLEHRINSMHKSLLAELEKLSKSRHNSFPSHSFRNFQKFSNTSAYEQYESSLISVVQDLNKLNTSEKFNAQTWARYIRVYVEARGIVDIMPAVDAFKFMESELLKLDPKRDPNNQYSQFLTKDYDSLKQGSRDDEPMIVEKLKETLQTQFHTKPDSRVIIFVTQRNTAQRVSNFLTRSGIMERFRSGTDDSMIGFVLGTNKQGPVQQTPQEQQATLARFNSGHLKILVATSVVEEGLDVTSCNLIVKYNCSSGNAIKLIQQRGRARAKNSRSVLLAVSSKVNERENNAILAERHMRACVKKIEEDGMKHLASEVHAAWCQLEKERERELMEAMERKRQHERDVYRLECSKCSMTFCRSTVIKKVYSNYMCFDPTIWDRVLVESKRKTNKYLDADTQPLSTLKCATCTTTIIGKAYKMRGVYLAQLDVKELAFLSENSTEGKTAKKWTQVETDLFWIDEARQGDFESMLNAFSNSETNMDKKRLLDLDSKQHIKDIEMKKYRDRDELKEREVEEHAERMRKLELGEE